MRFFELFKSDVYRYSGKLSCFSFLKVFLLNEGARFSFFFRLSSILSGYNPLYWIIFLILRFLSRWYGFQIPSKTNIGYGLYIGHHGTVILNVGSVIGNNCNLSPGVIIGQVSEGQKKGCPIIGNNVWIGSNSVIVGHIHIGDNSHICPNSFVTSDIPANSLVIGNPALVKTNWEKSDFYILNKWELKK